MPTIKTKQKITPLLQGPQAKMKETNKSKSSRLGAHQIDERWRWTHHTVFLLGETSERLGEWSWQPLGPLLKVKLLVGYI